MSGFFKVSSIKNLDEVKVGDVINTSDFATLTKDGKFLQLEYVEPEDKVEPYKVKPGIYSLVQTAVGPKLEKSSFTENKILKNNNYVKLINKQINKFFEKKDIYKKYGFDVPKRGILLWGGPGGGKSTLVTEIANQYKEANDTLIVLWPSDKIDPYEVKQFIKRFEYTNGANKLILVIEDLGGVEVDQVRIKSMSSLLSLLDNVEKTFTVPTVIISTTNHPENFLGSITNRPQRFDTKIEVKPPNSAERVEFLDFFSNNSAPEEVREELKHKKYSDLTPAHIKEVLMRAELNDITMTESLKEIYKEIETYKKMFATDKSKLGISSEPDFDF